MYPQKKVLPCKAVATLLPALVFAAGIIVFFIIGGIFFAKENPKIKHYENTMCQVDSRNWRSYTCQTRYSYYTCYGPVWRAHFQLNYQTINTVVEQEQRYDSYRDALDKANEYEINGNYSCWYDTRDPTVAQWDKPSIVVAAILLGCGALCVILTALLFFLTCRIVQEHRIQKQMQPDYVYPPSYQAVYTKQ